MAGVGIETNEYGYDRWGASPRAAARTLALVRVLYRHYFRVEAHGLDHVPSGRVLLIGNHSAQLAYDGMLIAASFVLDAEPPRFVRAMIERFFANPPFVNVMMARMGQLIGIPQNCKRLLSEDEAAVLVFPEGERGGGKVFKNRYKLMGFGHGFMRLALETQTPIVPVAVVGAEEQYPSLGDIKPLAKLLGMPAFPVIPQLFVGMLAPLPTKYHLYFGEPLRFEGDPDDDDAVIEEKVWSVRTAIESMLQRGLEAREGVFF